ncbi:HAMP domain-containing protein, partial [Bacteriovoracaceae bacterium]|nr:HAMP domain-containing protein [Bacteriovoracaceae bacterium]
MKKRHSLFFKLLIIFSLLAVGILITFILSFKVLGNQAYKKSFHDNMENYLNYIIHDIPRPISKQSLKEVQDKLNVGIIFNQLKSDSTLPDLEELTHKFSVNKKMSFAHLNKGRYVIYRIENDTFAFAMNLEGQENSSLWAMLVACLISLLLLAIAHLKIKKLFSPLEKIKDAASHFAQGDFDYPIKIQGKGQLSQLAQSIQEMGEKIQMMLESQRELLLAMAHELRTPLTRAKLHMELIEDSRKTELMENLDEMGNLVQDILESERIKQNHKT